MAPAPVSTTPHVQDVQQIHHKRLEGTESEREASDRLCELNVIEQVSNACQTTIARDAWERGQTLEVHGWIYGLQDGLLRDLKTTVSGFQEAPKIYRAAVSALSLITG